jgi:porphobilinogen deaminase
MDGKILIKGTQSGPLDQAVEIGRLLAQNLLGRGAYRILEEIKRLGE